MARNVTAESGSQTLPFDRFWSWLQAHPNCILRAGTPEAIVMDDEDFHWHFTVEGPETFLVQVIRGKRLVAELALNPAEVAYVQMEPGEQADEFVFDVVAEDERQRSTAFQFVMSHAFDEDETTSAGRITH